MSHCVYVCRYRFSTKLNTERPSFRDEKIIYPTFFFLPCFEEVGWGKGNWFCQRNFVFGTVRVKCWNVLSWSFFYFTTVRLLFSGWWWKCSFRLRCEKKKKKTTKRDHREIYSPSSQFLRAVYLTFSIVNNLPPPTPILVSLLFIYLFFFVVAPSIFKFSFSFFRKNRWGWIDSLGGEF